jgi:RNA-binding protein
MVSVMATIELTGAKRSQLRARGQRLSARVKVGREGLTPALVAELQRHFQAHDLIKVRFVGSDRADRAALCPALGRATGSAWVGSVGSTALFYLPPAASPPA